MTHKYRSRAGETVFQCIDAFIYYTNGLTATCDEVPLNYQIRVIFLVEYSTIKTLRQKITLSQKFFWIRWLGKNEFCTIFESLRIREHSFFACHKEKSNYQFLRLFFIGMHLAEAHLQQHLWFHIIPASRKLLKYWIINVAILTEILQIMDEKKS